MFGIVVTLQHDPLRDFILYAIWLAVAGCTIYAVFRFANFCRKDFVRWLGKPHWAENRDLAFWIYVVAALASVLAIGFIAVAYSFLNNSLTQFLRR